MDLVEFNAAPDEELTHVLRACCDVPQWAAVVRAGRPYPEVADLLAVADHASRELTAGDVDRALAAHPRIGERAQGTGEEAAWSRREQQGVERSDRTATELVDGNRAYEDRFGRVFLICASGRNAEEILTALQARLDNDEETEAAVVADELRQIALLRLRNVVDQSITDPVRSTQ